MLELLVEYKANTNIINHNNNSPLLKKNKNNNTYMVKHVLKYGHDLDPDVYNNQSKKSILYWPLKYKNVELVKLLKQQGFINKNIFNIFNIFPFL